MIQEDYLGNWKYLQSTQEALDLVTALHSTDMPACKEALFEQIAGEAHEEQLAMLTKALGAETGIRILKALLMRVRPHIYSSSGACTDMEKSIGMCAKVLAAMQSELETKNT